MFAGRQALPITGMSRQTGEINRLGATKIKFPAAVQDGRRRFFAFCAPTAGEIQFSTRHTSGLLG